MRPVWNPDARIQARRTASHLRMDPNNEREMNMQTRNAIEMASTRAVMRWQECREIARTNGFAAAARAMLLGRAES